MFSISRNYNRKSFVFASCLILLLSSARSNDAGLIHLMTSNKSLISTHPTLSSSIFSGKIPPAGFVPVMPLRVKDAYLSDSTPSTIFPVQETTPKELIIMLATDNKSKDDDPITNTNTGGQTAYFKMILFVRSPKVTDIKYQLINKENMRLVERKHVNGTNEVTIPIDPQKYPKGKYIIKILVDDVPKFEKVFLFGYPK